jgi:hypothetical protein
MTSVLDVARAWFRAEGWPCADDASGALTLSFRGEDATYACVAEEREGDVIVFHAVAPESIPEARMSAMLELCARINAQLAFGNFDVDIDAGVVRFRTAIDVEGASLSAALMKNLCIANLATMDQFHPKLRAVLAGADPRTILNAR